MFPHDTCIGGFFQCSLNPSAEVVNTKLFFNYFFSTADLMEISPIFNKHMNETKKILIMDNNNNRYQ